MAKKGLLLTLGAGYICTQISNVNKIDIKDELCVTKLEDKKTNVGVFISDNGICDSIILLHLNKKSDKVNVATFVKDFYIEEKKLGRVYNQCGPIETIRVLNEGFKLSINNYIKLDYSIIENIINKIDGIKLKLVPREAATIEGLDKGEDGIYILNGRQTIDYLKSKPLDNGDKSKKQKKVLKVIMDKVMEVAPKEFIALISDVIPSIETSLKTRELIGIALSCMKIGVDNISKNKFPLDNDLNKINLENEIKVQCNLENTIKEIHNFLNNIEK